MQRIVSSITTLEQHFRAMNEAPQEYGLRACPYCGVNGPWGHGRYWRKVDRRRQPDEARAWVPVPRFLCRGCGVTHSRVPLCIAPRRWFNWTIQQIVLAWLLMGGSVRSSAQRVGVDRHTVRRWRDWLRGPQVDQFVFYLRSRFAELGRCDDGPPFWREVFAQLGLAPAMACLDRLMDVP